MRLPHSSLVLTSLLMLAGCAGPHTSWQEQTPTYFPPEGLAMQASWYGPGFHGKKTASGEVYDMNAFTAAHKELPFGTRIEVTNPKNDRSAIVTINDRGPYVAGRDLDLSKAAAERIGLIQSGVGLVHVRRVGYDTRYDPQGGDGPSGQPFAVQVGSFSSRTRANAHLANVKGHSVDPVYIRESEVNGHTVYRVMAGSFDSRAEADKAAERLRAAGFSTLVRRQTSPGL